MVLGDNGPDRLQRRRVPWAGITAGDLGSGGQRHHRRRRRLRPPWSPAWVRDDVTAGAGEHYRLGRQRQSDHDSDGAIKVLATSDVDNTTGGDDSIVLGDGANQVLAGMGSDTITAGLGTDLVLGDNGTITYAGSVGALQLATVTSTVLDQGGDDTINLGDGDATVLGGFGSDDIAGSGAGTATRWPASATTPSWATTAP